MGEILIAGLASLLISIFLGPKFIQFLRTREFGQHIREEGPAEHQLKAGTPTMGGLVIFTAVAIPYLILSDRDAASLAVFGTAMACAAIGFADDWLKIVKARSLGLSARVKLALQLVIAVGLWLVATEVVGLDDTLEFRIFDNQIDIGAFYGVLVFLVLAGATNGVNLTDGLDGLAAGCAGIVLLTYTSIVFITGGQDGLSITEQDGLSLLGACLVGSSVGFLWFNSFPAAIFMGDTGSLGLGGAIAGMAVMTKSEVLLIVIGGIFVMEALSVAVAGALVPALPPPRAADGADPPPLRAIGLVGDQDHRPLLDHGRDRQRDRLHALPAIHRRVSPVVLLEVCAWKRRGSGAARQGRREPACWFCTRATEDVAWRIRRPPYGDTSREVPLSRPPLPGGPYLVAGLARSGVAAALALRAADPGAHIAACDSGAPREAAEAAGRLRAGRRRSPLEH